MFAGAPSSVKISGPDTINHNSNYTYSCKVEGGNPRPTMRWKVNDVSMSGEEVEERLTRLAVVTGEEERTMTVSCIAENSLGVVSRSLHVDTEYLPQRIMIQAPATIMEGEEAAVSCLTSQSHPAPRVTWKLEKVGATHEIREKVERGETTLVVGHEGEDGGRLYRAGFVIEASEDISFVEVRVSDVTTTSSLYTPLQYSGFLSSCSGGTGRGGLRHHEDHGGEETRGGGGGGVQHASLH